MALTTEKTDLDAILVKQINIDAKLTSVILDNEIVSTKKYFKIYYNFIRPNDTNQYSINDYICANPRNHNINLTAQGVITNGKPIVIDEILLFSDNGVATTTLEPMFLFHTLYDMSNTISDNIEFNPPFNEFNEMEIIQTFSENNFKYATGYSAQKQKLNRICKTRSNGTASIDFIDFTMVAKNAYQPIALEEFNVVLTGWY